MTFYDYDMTGPDSYALRADTKPLGDGRYCVVRARPGKDAFPWERKTKWNGNGSIRYEIFASLDEALTSGIKWARRREREDRRAA